MEKDTRVVDKLPKIVKVLIHLVEAVGCPWLIYAMITQIILIENSLIFTLIFLACIVFGLNGIFNLFSYMLTGLNGEGIPDKDLVGADDVAQSLIGITTAGLMESITSSPSSSRGFDINACRNADGSINEVAFRQQLRRAFEEADRYNLSANHAYFENMKNRHNNNNKK